MKIIEIKTQAELDAFVDGDEFVEIRIVAPQIVCIVVNKTYKNASVEARESSRVEAWGSDIERFRNANQWLRGIAAKVGA